MRWRLIVTMVLVGLVGVPFGMAVDGCSGMGTTCEGSRAASSIFVTALATVVFLLWAGSTALGTSLRVPDAALTTPDAPPKSPLFA
jgi:hypothetical protein